MFNKEKKGVRKLRENSFLIVKYIVVLISKKYKQVTYRFRKKFHKIESFVLKSNISKSVFSDLTPKGNLKDYNEYIESLDWALSKENIKNIALTGPYGSGKSSIIETLKENRPHYNFLNISLATFHTQTVNKQNEDENTRNKNDLQLDNQDKIVKVDEQEIEKRILQQLFYKVKSKKIPFGRFRKITDIKGIAILKGFSLFISTLALLLFLLYPNFYSILWKNISESYLLLESFNIPLSIVVLGYLLLLILIGRLIIVISKISFKSLKINKVRLKNTEIDVNDKSDDNSIFNKYLDELLYFFEVNDYQIVFIEDLDRFNDINIFIKLRELNSLINNSEEINRRVVFIYAIKDDMFINKERTKFFDFIIPVIPIINTINSGDILWKQLQRINMSDGITESFIMDICLYIDDMRVLNNILNEYIIYKNKLMSGNDLFLNPQRMFSMIVYKNIYPNDFAKLQFNKGFVQEIHERKQEIIEREIQKLDEEKEIIETKLSDANEEYLQSEKELKTIFWNEITGYRQSVYNVRIKGNWYSMSDFITSELDLSQIAGETIIQYTTGNGNRREERGSVEKELIERFVKRFESINNKIVNKKIKLRVRLGHINNSIQTMKSWSLEKTISEFGLDRFFPKRDSENALIIFLLRNGYIDELYPHYINHFYEGSLTYNDMIFIMNIKDQIALDFNHPLIKIEKTITRLNLIEFDRKEILNYDLLDYLLENSNYYQQQLKKIMYQLSDEEKNSIQFIDTFLNVTKNKEKFIYELCKKWDNIWVYFYNNSSFTVNKKEEYLRYILSYADIDSIKAINIKNSLVNYLSGMKLFLELIDNGNLSKIMNVIEELDIRFKSLSITAESNLDLLEFIIDNNYYELNYYMVELVTKQRSNINSKLLQESHLTTIKKLDFKPIWEYIHENISLYAENVLFSLKSNVNEDENVILYLLNEETISPEVKKEIVSNQNASVDIINDVDESLWGYLLSSSKVKASWHNVLSYFKQDQVIDNYLAEFLNSNENAISLSKNLLYKDVDFDDTLYKSISREIMISEEITKDSFYLLRNSLPYRYNDFPCEELSSARLIEIINYNLFNFTEELFNGIRSHHKDVLPLYVNKYINDFIEELDNLDVDSDDINNILQLNDLSIESGIKLIEFFDEDITCDNPHIANAICNIILSSKEKIEISEELLLSVLSQKINPKLKVSLLVNQKDFIDFGNMEEYLNNIGNPYKQFLILKKRPTVNDNKMNRDLLDILEKQNLISSYKKEGDLIRVYSKHKVN